MRVGKNFFGKLSGLKISRQYSAVGAMAAVSLTLMLILVGCGVYPIYTKPQMVEATTGVATESITSLTLDSSSSSSQVNLLVNSVSGNFAASADGERAIFNVETNNYTGYTLSISAPSGDDSGRLENGENYLSSISANTTDTSTGFSNGEWGYMPSTYYENNTATNNNTTKYFASPSTTATTLDVATTANTGSAKEYSIGLGIKADYTKPAGSYTKTFTIIATANPTPYSITYAKSTSESSEKIDLVTPNPQFGSLGASDTAITLSSVTPTRDGYSFKAWCLGTVSNSGTTCTGAEYTKGSSFGIDQTASSNTATLYAVWTPNKYTCTKQYRLQNADGNYPSTYTSAGSEEIAFGSECSYTQSATDYTTKSTSGTMNSTSGITLSLDLPRTTYTLTVNRNTTYISSVSGAGTYRWGQAVSISATAASNSEFNGWSLSSGTAGTFGNASSASTTFTMGKGNATIYADGKSSKTYIQDFTKANCSSLASSGNYTVYDKRDENSYTVRYINNNCWMTQNLRFSGTSINSSTTNINTTKTISWSDLTSGNTYDAARYHNSGNATNGYWYNYAGASAMTITGSSNTTEASYSICPAGWRLPTYSEFSGITSYSSAFSPVTGGYYYDGSVGITGYGYWWSSTASYSSRRYYLYWNGSSLDAGSLSRYFGFYVRCIRSS